jgi:hypothetical protein
MITDRAIKLVGECWQGYEFNNQRWFQSLAH